MKFLLYLVMIFLFLHGFVTSSPLIRDSCKKAAAKDRKLNHNFCVQSLEGNPHSKTAKNFLELVMASIKNAETKTKSLKTMVRKNLDERKYPKDSEMQIRECLEFYEHEGGAFEMAFDFVKKRDYKFAIMRMNDALNSLDACETGFKERVTPTFSPFAKENEVLSQIMMIPLAFTRMLK